MDWRAIKEKWPTYRQAAQRQWPELSEAELRQVAGNRTDLIVKLREHYGWGQEEATLEADRWADRLTGEAEVVPESEASA
jgi:hypothetical protein